MISLSIDLDDLIFNPNQRVDWQALSEEELLVRLGQIYGFLPAPVGIAIEGQTATIESPFDSQDNRRSRKLLEKATAEASRGRYAQALLDENGRTLGFTLSHAFVSGPIAEKRAIACHVVQDVGSEDGAMTIDLEQAEQQRLSVPK